MMQPHSLDSSPDPFHQTMMNVNTPRWIFLVCMGLLLSPSLVQASTPAWWPLIDTASPTEPLAKRYRPPTGFHRVAVGPQSFAAWLRTLPIRTDRMQVLSYQGLPLKRPSAGIVAMDVGDRDLMQCADSIIRLHAEYLWAHGRQNEAKGDEMNPVYPPG